MLPAGLQVAYVNNVRGPPAPKASQSCAFCTHRPRGKFGSRGWLGGAFLGSTAVLLRTWPSLRTHSSRECDSEKRHSSHRPSDTAGGPVERSRQNGHQNAKAAVTKIVPKISMLQDKAKRLREGELQEVMSSVNGLQGEAGELEGMVKEVDELLYALVTTIGSLQQSTSQNVQHSVCSEAEVDQWVHRLRDGLLGLARIQEEEKLLSTIPEISMLSLPANDKNVSEEQCSRYSQGLLRYEYPGDSARPLMEAACLFANGRLEFYLAAPETQRSEALKFASSFLRNHFGIAEEVPNSHVVIKSGKEAVKHLFEVASGLRSPVLGEVKILAKVKACYDRSIAHGSSDSGSGIKPITKLLNAGVRTGKLVRTCTSISKGAISSYAAAIEVASIPTQGQVEGSACIVGDGPTARWLLIHLARQHPDLSVRLFASSEDAAQEIIREAASAVEAAGATSPCGASELPYMVADDCRWLFLSVEDDARELLVRAVERTVQDKSERFQRGCKIVDISEPSLDCFDCLERKGVAIHTAESVHEVVSKNLALRKNEAERASLLIAQQAGDFEVWLCSQGAFPYLQELQLRAEEIRKDESSKIAPKLKGFHHQDKEAVDIMTKALVAKLLLPVMHSVRDPEDTTSEKREKIMALKNIFKLGAAERPRSLPPTKVALAD